MQGKKRIDWIDAAKGFGIILVIMGHCFNKGSLLHNWIFSFHMPLFFILSGYCFNLDRYGGFGEVFRDKFRRLLVPYLGFCLLGLAVSALIPVWRAEFSVRQFLVDIYCAYPTLTHITSIWYLVSVFILSLLLYVVVTFARRYRLGWLPAVFVALSGCMGYLITVIRKLFFVTSETEAAASAGGFSLPGGRLPLTLDTCMTALVFFAFGYFLRRYAKAIGTLRRRTAAGLALAALNVAVALGLNTRVNLHGCTYGNVFFFYTAAVSGTFAVCLLAMEVCRFRAVRDFLVFYGRNSLYVLGLQSLLINLYVMVLNETTQSSYELFEDLPTAHGWCAFVLITVLTGACVYFVRPGTLLHRKQNG